jgi:hypothetical protein
MSDDARLELVLNAAMWTFDRSTRATADAQIRDMLQALHALGWHGCGSDPEQGCEEIRNAA